MLLEELWGWLRERVFPTPSTPTLFNQYGCTVLGIDLPGGDAIRRNNLLNYLSAFRQRPCFAVIGEAPGWRGCRFSGVPFTSEAQLCNRMLPFAGTRSSAPDPPPLTENSATHFWRNLLPYHPQLFAWNAIPFHPHVPRTPLSNRTPSTSEIDEHSTMLAELLSLLKPQSIIAIGRSAERALNRIGVSSMYVRHPARGGAAVFRSGIERAFAGGERLHHL